MDPVALELFGLKIHWYGIMWVLAVVQFYLVTRRWGHLVVDKKTLPGLLDSLMFYVLLGCLVGGRLGYVLFYGLGQFLEDPLWALRIWEGGMSFHGGLLGAVVAILAAARPHRDTGALRVGDLVSLGTPLGLGLGRLGNLINGELWGRASDVPWAVVVKAAGPEARHPSQVYEALGEGLLLFLLLLALAKRRPPPGTLAAAFLVGYSALRFSMEYFREPDAHIGYLALGLSMGQWLCVPTLLAGLGLYWLSALRRHPGGSRRPG